MTQILNIMKSNILKNALATYENKIGGRFKPDQRFYHRVDINQKRFGQLVRGEKPILGFEAKNLAVFFDLTLEELI